MFAGDRMLLYEIWIPNVRKSNSNFKIKVVSHPYLAVLEFWVRFWQFSSALKET